MTDFSYALRNVDVVFAVGALAKLGEQVNRVLGAKRCLLVSTPGRHEATEASRRALDDRVAATFAGARLHVPVAIVEEAHQVLRDAGADAIVAVGGGSPIGVGKALAVETGLPLVAVATTYSGSEMTNIWGVTSPDGKRTGRDARAAPRLVVYDPELTYSMPANVSGPSGINAIAHSVEALYSASANPASSALAAEGIRLLASALPVVVERPDVAASRADALAGAHLCGRALDMTTMGLHHKLCHVLGGTLDLPHALTHAIVLPYAVAYNSPAAPREMEIVASALCAASAAAGETSARGRETAAAGVASAAAGKTSAALELWKLNQKLGITQTLADLGMRTSDVERVVEGAMRMSYPNPAPITGDGVRTILRRALTGEPPPAEGSLSSSGTSTGEQIDLSHKTS